MIKDLICTFIIFTVILLTVTLIVSRDFLKDTLSFENGTLTLFSHKITPSKNIPRILDGLLCFNDILFGKSFSYVMKSTGNLLFESLLDLLTVFFGFAKEITGAA